MKHSKFLIRCVSASSWKISYQNVSFKSYSKSRMWFCIKSMGKNQVGLNFFWPVYLCLHIWKTFMSSQLSTPTIHLLLGTVWPFNFHLKLIDLHSYFCFKQLHYWQLTCSIFTFVLYSWTTGSFKKITVIFLSFIQVWMHHRHLANDVCFLKKSKYHKM